MRLELLKAEFECPYCGQGFELDASEAMHIDHIRDECSEKCEACGGMYQLRCVYVEVFLSCTKATGE